MVDIKQNPLTPSCSFYAIKVVPLCISYWIYQTHGGAALIKTVHSLAPTIIDKNINLNFLITYICTEISIILCRIMAGLLYPRTLVSTYRSWNRIIQYVLVSMKKSVSEKITHWRKINQARKTFFFNLGKSFHHMVVPCFIKFISWYQFLLFCFFNQ